jgi:hypothetical protein
MSKKHVQLIETSGFQDTSFPNSGTAIAYVT